MAVQAGREAPDFELPDHHRTPVRLSGFRGRQAVVLFFYPWAFSGICGGEMAALRDRQPALATDDVALLAISVDSVYALRVFAERDGLEFPLLSDFWPHGAVARAYGVFDQQMGVALRGTFVVDRVGIVRSTLVNGIGDRRDVAELEKALAGL
jgi:mycoredoxin-dependent peroxiredoxin